MTNSSRIPSLGPRGEGWVALQFLIIGAIGVAGLLVRIPLEGAAWFAALVVGAVLVIGGLALAFRGVRDLGRSLSPMPRPLDDATLVEHGVYRSIRHPIYAGLILAAAGWSVATASVVALALTGLLALVLDLKSRREEAWLHEQLPGYASYAQRTKRFVPGVY